MTEEKTTLIEFPCDFPIKVMGVAHPAFVTEILQVVLPHAPDTLPEHISVRPSRAGNYLGATLIVRAENQEQLDAIYRALTSHQLVKVVL